MGLLDFLGLGAPALSPQEQQYVSFLGGNPGATMAAMDPRALRSQAAWGALGEVGARIADAYAPRPITQPRPSLGAAIGSFGPAYSRGLMTGAQAQQLEQQAQRQQAYQGLLNQMPESQRALFATLPPEQGALAIAQSQLRQGRPGTPEEHQQLGLPPGTLWFDNNGRPHTVNTPALAGMTTDATERARAPYHPFPVVPGGTLVENPAIAGQPTIRGVTGALPQLASAESGNDPNAYRSDTGATGTYQFIPSTWSWLRQNNPEFGRRWSDADIRNPRAQQEAAPLYERAILERNQDLIGRQVNGVPVTPQALVRGGWLGGPDGVRQYVLSGGAYNPADANRTRIGDYFNGTAPNMRGGNGAAMAPAPLEPYVAGSNPTLPQDIQGRLPWNQAQAPTAAPSPAAPAGPRVLYQSPNPAPGTMEGRANQEYAQHNQNRLNAMADQTASSMQVVSTLREMRNQIDQGLQVGSLAEGRQAVANFLRTFLPPERQGLADAIMAPDSRAYQAQAGQLVLALLGGRLGAQISDSDRGAIERIVPQLYDNPESARRIMDILDRRHNETIERNVGVYRRSIPSGAAAEQDALLNQYGAWREANPVTRPVPQAAAPAAAPAGTQAPAPTQGDARQSLQPVIEPTSRANPPAAAAQQQRVMPRIGDTATHPITRQQIRWDGMRWVPVTPRAQ